MNECVMPAPAPGANTYSARLLAPCVKRPDTCVVAGAALTPPLPAPSPAPTPATCMAIGLVSASVMSQCSTPLSATHSRRRQHRHGSPARTLHFQAFVHAHAGARAEDRVARRSVAVRDPETCGAPAAL